MLWFYIALGLLSALLSGLANGSMRRFVVAGSLALSLIFVAFPFSEALGFLSRETISPTLFGVLPTFPILILIPLASVLGLVGAHLGRRMSGLAGVLGGSLALIVGFSWLARSPYLAQVRPLNGLMEAVSSLSFVAVIILLVWGRPKLRLPLSAAAIVIGGLVFWWLNSPVGYRYFPNAQGYYKVFINAPQGSEERLVEAYNQGLDELNRQRARIGLTQLEPISSITGLEGQKIPRAAAEEGFRLINPASRKYGTGIFFLLAGLMLGAGLMQLWRPNLEDSNDLISGGLFTAVILVLTPAFSATDFSITRLVEGWPFFLDFLDRAWPPLLSQPEFSRFPLQEVASQMLITLEIALVGTFLAAIFAIPMSFFASRNLTQGNAFMRTVFGLTRGFFNIDRGIDTLILALIFVAAVGLGPLAGVMAMAIHSIADLGKVYSESIENVDQGPIEALEAVGASGSNVVRWAILPQVMPLFVGWTLYRFEINFRVSIVLGLVGAGGIGFFIQEKMASGQYNQMIIAIIAIIIVVNIIDFASSWLRGRLV